MVQRKLLLSIVLSVSAALTLSVGCKKDEDAADDKSACEKLCDASSECGDVDDCVSDCEEVSVSCPSQVEAYLDCADGATDIECVDGVTIGIAQSCLAEAVAIQMCAVSGDGDGDGDGDMPGDGDGDMPGDGDGDMGGSPGDGDMGGGGGVGGAN